MQVDSEPHSGVWSSSNSSDDDLRPPSVLPLHLSTAKPQQRVRFHHEQLQHSPESSCGASWSVSSSSPMQMSAYESMLASQQWTQQRVRQASAAQDAAQQIPTHRVVSTLGLAALTYFVCCGGPVGTEPLVSSGGPLRGLIAQVAFPLLFNAPIMLAVIELATAYANDGGYTVWVMHAFGAFWGFQVGLWSWLASLFDRVVYIQFLFAHLAVPLGYAYGDRDSIRDDGIYHFSFAGAYAVKAAAAVLLSLPTMFCTKTLVRALCVHLALVIIPLLVLTVWGLAKTQSLTVFSETEPDAATVAVAFSGAWSVDWRTYVGVFWYYDGFYLAAVFGGEVAKPHRTYPQGFKWSFVLTWLSYLLPMVAVVGAAGSSALRAHAVGSASAGSSASNDVAAAGAASQRVGLHWSLFEENAYPDIARVFGGSALYAISLVGLVAGVTGMYMAKLFCQAYQMLGMAEHELLPSLFAHRNQRYGSPRQSIYFSTAMVLALLAINDLSDLHSVKDALSGLVELAIIVAALRLRQAQPFVVRSFKIPGGLCGMSTLLLLPTLLLSYQVGLQFSVRKTAAVLCGILATGVVLSAMQLGRRSWRQKQQRKAIAMMRMTPMSTMALTADDLYDSTVVR